MQISIKIEFSTRIRMEIQTEIQILIQVQTKIQIQVRIKIKDQVQIQIKIKVQSQKSRVQSPNVVVGQIAGLSIGCVYLCCACATHWPWLASNLQSLVPNTNALSIRPQGRCDIWKSQHLRCFVSWGFVCLGAVANAADWRPQLTGLNPGAPALIDNLIWVFCLIYNLLFAWTGKRNALVDNSRHIDTLPEWSKGVDSIYTGARLWG